MKNIDVSRKGLYQICKLKFIIPENGSAEILSLKIKLTANNAVYSENEWGLWKYNKPKGLTFPKYTDIISYSNGKILITDNIEKAIDAANDGGSVCLVYRENITRDRKCFVGDEKHDQPKYAFKASWNRFKPVIWDRRGTNFGGLCDGKLLTK